MDLQSRAKSAGVTPYVAALAAPQATDTLLGNSQVSFQQQGSTNKSTPTQLSVVLNAQCVFP